MPIPPWHLDVHSHKDCLVQNMHTASDFLEKPEAHMQKSFCSEKILACSKRRKWCLNSRDRYRKVAIKFLVQRFFYGLESP